MKSLHVFLASLMLVGTAFSQSVPPVGDAGPVNAKKRPSPTTTRESPPPPSKTQEEIEQERYYRTSYVKRERTYKALMSEWYATVSRNKREHEDELKRSSVTQRQRLQTAKQSAESMHNWNDEGADAYGRKEYGNAANYFRSARQHAPSDPTVLHNLKVVEGKLSARATDHLSSLDTSIEIVSLAREVVMVLQPDPNIRAEGQRDLARKSLERVANEAAKLIIEERLNRGIVKAFRWESTAERMARQAEAIRHAERVESLRTAAHGEARELAGQFARAGTSARVHLKDKPATNQLLTICVFGFDVIRPAGTPK